MPIIPYVPPSPTIRVAAPIHSRVGTGAVAAEREPGSASEPASDNDVNNLLTLSSFLAPAREIPLDMLHRGATPRKRWDKKGGIASRASDVDPGLASLLADRNRVSCVVQKLWQSGEAARCPTAPESYIISEETRRRIQDNLNGEHQTFWKTQALLVAYYALSWKNIEARIMNPAAILPHVQFVLAAHDSPGEVVATSDAAIALSADAKEDLILTLTEAVRLPDMGWKRFAIHRVRDLCAGVQDPYVTARVSERESLVSRLSGQDPRVLDDLNQMPLNIGDQRMHAARGFAAIEKSLNHVQIEELQKAEGILKCWQPLREQSNLMGQVVLLRKHVLLGKIQRFQGQFHEAVRELETAFAIVKQNESYLNFEEDAPDLICNYADALRERGSFEEGSKQDLFRPSVPWKVYA
ncbi:hypothetical protein LX32DRAFT_657868 [Colletotrichum zoysiae]|uniref:Uncharacterized protein n=1 Tax=Colletotrichum zoysiae TaxID=1216348 RepID=A0AAD9LXS9_9PEZI|nr:hypothetical protein LX32DRAFT_657868 [Colletotrichum zoysiae]